MPGKNQVNGVTPGDTIIYSNASTVGAGRSALDGYSVPGGAVWHIEQSRRGIGERERSSQAAAPRCLTNAGRDATGVCYLTAPAPRARASRTDRPAATAASSDAASHHAPPLPATPNAPRREECY